MWLHAKTLTNLGDAIDAHSQRDNPGRLGRLPGHFCRVSWYLRELDERKY